MISPKSVARWQELKARKLSDRTVSEDMEYKKLRMKYNADVLALNELKWKVKLAGAVPTLANNNDDLMQRLNGVISSQIGDDQKPLAKKDLHDLVTAFVVEIKREQQEQSHTKPLEKDPLHDDEFPSGNNPD